MVKRKLRGNVVNVYKCLKELIEVKGGRLFSVATTDRTRGNGHKIKKLGIPSEHKNTLFY